MSKISWVPKKKGHLYCSPACGRGCTWEKYVAANEAARALSKKLGEGWSNRVWENLGWHYEVVSPNGQIHISVSGNRANSYLAILSNQWVGHASSPETAVNSAILSAEPDLRRFRKLMEQIKEWKLRKKVKRVRN